MFEAAKQSHERALNGMHQLEAQLSFRFAVLQRLLDRQMTRLLARHDVSLASYRILVTIEAFEEIAAADLVRLVVVDKGLVSRACAEMQEAGLIDARPDPRSGRRKLLRLTQTGAAKLATLKTDVEARNAGLDAQLEAGERIVLEEILSKLTTHVAETLAEPAMLRGSA